MALGLGCTAYPFLWVCERWQPATDPVEHPPKGSGMGAQPRFQVSLPTQALCVCAPRQLDGLSWCAHTRGFRCGLQVTDWGTLPLGHFGSGAQAAWLLIRARAHPEFQLWAPSLLIWVCASRALGERWGCFSGVHSPGAEGGGVPEAAAVESSLTSNYVPLFSFPF